MVKYEVVKIKDGKYSYLIMRTADIENGSKAVPFSWHITKEDAYHACGLLNEAEEGSKTPTLWNYCGQSRGKICSCGFVWSDDNMVAKVTNGEFGETYVDGYGERHEIAYGKVSQSEFEYNIKLIASAPALLKLVKRCRSIIDRAQYSPSLVKEITDFIDKIEDKRNI
ncbi:hypothetical protein M0R04_15235 [Candidatus Dojkabacteria bacterium]|nr:hypothetical protein [Candidatus Dojkabacteria bacterium]